MQLPDEQDWILIRDVAKRYGRSPVRVYHWAKHGRVSISGERIRLQTWRTVKGTVTTERALAEFQNQLNQF